MTSLSIHSLKFVYTSLGNHFISLQIGFCADLHQSALGEDPERVRD
jgi:hypothetical protein